MKNRNISLSYLIVGLNNAFFWYAPWLLFVYKYIDIKQATILQMVAVLTRIIAEVPTGAVSDLLGKKRTLLIAFFLSALGEITMAFSSNFISFIIVYVILGLGQSFYSGTIDAFIYDSLLEKKGEKDYPKVLAKSNAYVNFSTAIATISGGFLFKIWEGLPFFITGITKLIGVFVIFFVTEPVVDTIRFSFKNFIRQNKQGFSNLFDRRLLSNTLLLVLLGSFSVIAYEILDDVAVVDWGYNATGISVLYTLVILISIPSGFLYNRLSKKIKLNNLVIFGILFLTANYLFSLWVNVVVWTLLFLFRVIFSPIKKAAIMEILNRNTQSSIRATTLSSYEFLVRLPFILFGVPIGIIMKNYGVKTFSVGFSAILLLLLISYFILNKKVLQKQNVQL